MATVDELTPFSIFARRNFLSPELCAQLRDEIAHAQGENAKVYLYESQGYVDAEDIRRVRKVSLDTPLARTVAEHFAATLPELSEHFGLSLAHFEPLSFLQYAPGDHFVSHRDAVYDPSMPSHIQQRRVSMVLFLNAHSATPAPTTFGGGELVMCVFGDEGELASMGLDLEPEEGLLIGFPSAMIHEVKPVLFGERYSVVTWARG